MKTLTAVLSLVALLSTWFFLQQFLESNIWEGLFRTLAWGPALGLGVACILLWSLLFKRTFVQMEGTTKSLMVALSLVAVWSTWYFVRQFFDNTIWDETSLLLRTP